MTYRFPTAEPCPACEWLAGRLPWAPVIVTPRAAVHTTSRQRTIGSVCVIPTRHARSLTELGPEEVDAVAVLVRRASTAIEKAFAPDGLHIWQSTGELGSQHRPHMHVNLVPRYEGHPYTFAPSMTLPEVPLAVREGIAARLRDAWPDSALAPIAQHPPARHEPSNPAGTQSPAG